MPEMYYICHSELSKFSPDPVMRSLRTHDGRALQCLLSQDEVKNICNNSFFWGGQLFFPFLLHSIFDSLCLYCFTCSLCERVCERVPIFPLDSSLHVIQLYMSGFLSASVLLSFHLFPSLLHLSSLFNSAILFLSMLP